MYDPHEDLKNSLDRQLLQRPEPPSHADARKRLTDAKLTVGLIIHVYPDCVLYVDDQARAMTAWARQEPGRAITYLAEPGFQAFPSPYLGDKPE